MRHFALISAICFSITLAAGCTKRASVLPPPPPAALPGVEVGGIRPMYHDDHPITVEAPREKPQPLRNLYFDTNEDTLGIGQVRQLARLAKWAQGKTIIVTGYADTVGTDEYNMALSLRRALAVAQHLPSASVEAKGETSQFPGGDAKNRRVTLEVK